MGTIVERLWKLQRTKLFLCCQRRIAHHERTLGGGCDTSRSQRPSRPRLPLGSAGMLSAFAALVAHAKERVAAAQKPNQAPPTAAAMYAMKTRKHKLLDAK